MQKVGVPLLKEKDVGLVLPEEGDTGGVDGAELLQVQFVVVGHEAGGVLQRLQQVRLELFLQGCVSELKLPKVGDTVPSIKNTTTTIGRETSLNHQLY